MAAIGAYLSGILGLALRILLMQTSFPKWLQTRNEVVTPVTAWDRVEEGFSLQKEFVSPYSGDLLHETPLALRFLKTAYYVPFGVKGFFIMIDFFTMMLLYKIAALFKDSLIREQNIEKKKYSSKAEKLVLTPEEVSFLPTLILTVHAVNPFSIMTLLAMSTASLSNLVTLAALYYFLKGNQLMCTLFLAVSTYQTFYPVIFIVPAALQFYLLKEKEVNYKYESSKSYWSKEAITSYLQTVGLFLFFVTFLLGISYLYLEGSLDFIYSTYGFVLTVPDLTPNVGVFWYFFTEMFDHFRTFFVCVFQLNAVIYTVPLTVKLAKTPFFLLYILLFLTSIFKSYPSYADAALYTSLLPLWRHTFSYFRNSLFVGGMYICCMVLAPILYHLWIFAGSANANFYFAITLTYSTAQIFLVTDLLFAYLRRDYDLYNGTEHKNVDGTKAAIVLE
ncbi:phosphatidylinositol glycan anchor biosynthesis class U protein [Biomphalaria pfeifferi]|uniref:Phosphatidylinositol glycan anchor biosynthesis class U protein n=1 Tax=Biomphalaria pfeifferi TaxID=112525 RepID=A0AAD8B2W9_BIOPF|nr:phosphatidylinositol glycan anchor biosynthesis class U protein [Biomphalaria pfeifferi]